MKYVSILFLSLLVLFVAGCSDDDDSGTNPTSNGTMSASVDGTAWSANTLQAVWTNNVLNVTGAKIVGSTNQQMSVAGLVTAPGTYQFGVTGVTATYVSALSTDPNQIAMNSYGAISGELVVTEITAAGAKGTFNFTGRNNAGTTVSVTSGSFDVKF